jgi:hypothetical protein
VCAVQFVKYYVHVDGVQKTLMSQLIVYHDRGADAYKVAVKNELAHMGMAVAPGALVMVEDRAHDEMRVELDYTWPLHVLWFELDRPNIALTRTTILDG